MIYSIIKCRFSGPVARQPLLPWQQFCAVLVWGFVLMLASKYEFDTITQYWVIAIFTRIRYVALWPRPWHDSNVTWCHLCGQSLYQVWTYRLRVGRLQFSIDRQLKVPICTFLEVKGSNLKFHYSNPQKALPWPERRIMTYCAWGASRDAICGRGEESKKRQKLSSVKLAIWQDHPRRHRPLKCCMRRRVREVVIYFKFHENRSRGLGAVGVENRPLPLTRPMAYTTACSTVKPWKKPTCIFAFG